MRKVNDVIHFKMGEYIYTNTEREIILAKRSKKEVNQRFFEKVWARKLITDAQHPIDPCVLVSTTEILSSPIGNPVTPKN